MLERVHLWRHTSAASNAHLHVPIKERFVSMTLIVIERDRQIERARDNIYFVGTCKFSFNTVLRLTRKARPVTGQSSGGRGRSGRGQALGGRGGGPRSHAPLAGETPTCGSPGYPYTGHVAAVSLCPIREPHKPEI